MLMRLFRICKARTNLDTASSSQESNFSKFERIQYVQNLVEKQLDLYGWCETKVTTLATIDSILIAGVTLFVDHVKTESFPERDRNNFLGASMSFIEKNLSLIAMVTVLLPVFLSLGTALWHVIPKMRSGTYTSPIGNHRSSAGIRKFATLEKYEKYMNNISFETIHHDLIHQIYGMNTNIWRNQRSIRMAVWFDIVALFFFMAIMVYLVINGNGKVFST